MPLSCWLHYGCFTEAKTHGVRRIRWPDSAPRDLSDQHIYLNPDEIVFGVQYDRDRHLADTAVKWFRQQASTAPKPAARHPKNANAAAQLQRQMFLHRR